MKLLYYGNVVCIAASPVANLRAEERLSKGYSKKSAEELTAIAGRDTDAQWQLGYRYAIGQGVATNSVRALELLGKAADMSGMIRHC